MRKIFTGLDFGGRRIKNVKIDDQPYFIPFVFSDANQSTPVPQEIIDELNHRIDYATEKGLISQVFIITDINITIPQTAIIEKSNNDIMIVGVLSDYNMEEDSNGNLELQMSQSVKNIIISSDGTWIKQEVSNIRNGNPPVFIVDYENYNSEVYDALCNVPENTIVYIAYNGSLLELRPLPAYGPRDYLLLSANDIIGTMSITNVVGFNINTFVFHLYPDGSKEVYSKIFDLIYGEDGTKFLSDDGTYKEIKSGESFYVVDLNNYTTNVFNELSEMTLGHIIKVITTDNRLILCQLADIEPDYIVLNSYMQYDDSNEDPHIVSYTLNADGTLQDPIERIKLETTGGGTKFLSDLGDYREIKNNDTYNVVTDNYTSEHFNELLDAINNKKSVFVDGVAMTPMMASSDMILLLSNVQYVRETISSETSSQTKHILSTNTYSFLPDGTYETGGETLPIDGNGTKFLSDDGTYKEVKTSDLTNTKVTQEEYNALEAAGTLDANTIYYIIG